MKLQVALVLCCATQLWGAGLSGIWTGRQPGRNGQIEDVAFRFQSDGKTLTGKLFGDEFDIPIGDAAVDGDQVRFTITTTNYYSGGKTKFAYSGVLRNGELELVRERVPSPDDRPSNRPPVKQTIKLERLK